MKIAFNETTGQYEQVTDAAPAGNQVVAEMENMSGTLHKITSFELAGIPVGAAAVGGLASILIDRIVLAKVDPTHKYSPWSLLVASALIAKFGRKYAGDAAKYTALILAYEGIADYVSMAVDKVWPATTTTAQNRSTQTAAAAQVGSPAAGDYYSQAFKR
jgi:hypothetical protein